jgi:3-phosphoshikimate 1-carboxyvinyltransferase
VALPDLIEIVPLDKPVRAEITVPGSKSITNRALILAALADGETTLRGALWSEDTQVMVECLQELGFMVNVEADPEELCNRTITVYGKGCEVPRGGTEEQPLELFVGNAGTAARFLAAFVCLGKGVYRLQGVPRMHERPQGSLFKALRELGYRIASPSDKLPAVIYGAGPEPGKCRVSIEESSQFASALLLGAKAGGWSVEVTGENAEESPYVAMTEKLIKAFPAQGGTFQIEPDASSGSYFIAAAELLPPYEYMEWSHGLGTEIPTTLLDRVKVAHWPSSGWQIDEEFLDVLYVGMDSRERLKQIGEKQIRRKERLRLEENSAISRKRHLGDSIMTAIVLAPFLKQPAQFTDLGRLRVQESERVVGLRAELTKCGAKVIEEGDTLTVFPSELHGAEIETYDDHRMAMCFAVVGIKVPGIKIRNPSCVKKTFPNFFQKLAAAPPHGIGATILEGRSGQVLGGDDLFAG